MRITITVYSQNAYKEYRLPVDDTIEYAVVLRKELFLLEKNLKLKLENLKGKWYFRESNAEILNQGVSCVNDELKERVTYACRTGAGELLYLTVRQNRASLEAYEKYCLPSYGNVTIGTGEQNMIVYSSHGENSYVSSQHAVLRQNADGWILEDCSANGTFINNKRVHQNVQLQYGDHMNIWGLDLVYLNEVLAVGTNAEIQVKLDRWRCEDQQQAAEAHMEQEWRDCVDFHRSPRNMELLETEEVEIEAPPALKEENKTPLFMQIGPALTMTLPMILGSGMAAASSRMSGAAGSSFMYTGLVTAGCSGALGVFWAANNIRYSESQRKKEETRRFDAYGKYLLKCASEIKGKYEHNTTILNERYPAAGQLMAAEEAFSENLWKRNPAHADFLYHRIGTGKLPFQVPILIPKEKFTLIDDSLAEKPRQIRDEYQTLHHVPIGIDLAENSIIGIVGRDEADGRYQIAKNLIAQIAAQNCYTDVKLALFCSQTDETADRKWQFASWLPHIWSEDHKFRYMSYGASEASDVSYEITKILRKRMEQQVGNSGISKDASVNLPYYIVVLEDFSLIEGELLERYILSGQNPGLTAIVLANSFEELPNVCTCVIEKDASFAGICRITDQGAVRTPVAFDSVDDQELLDFSRKLSRLKVKENEAGGEIPGAVTFFDMYGIRKLEELHVSERWRKNHIYESMKALIGIKAGNQPCYLDLHEKYHGPHGLVAGTTGSGKSETLQTYILSLAINFSPEDVGFFIIDYKGGGMGNLFSGLPHILGQISNLSGNQIHRAMVSIKSENVRRQRIFNENGVNNINAYTRLYKQGEAKVPIPHLFIVIDEFAELKREEPDFMRELISVAQVGRSLGVHLILATQKPAGTVDDNIWSNSKFHLCLRVQDRQDSMDMLHKADAAYLTGAGRGYLQVGNDELYELFQSGWSGAAYEEPTDEGNPDAACMLTTTGKTAVVGNYAKSRRIRQEKENWITELLKLYEPVQKENLEAEPETRLAAWHSLIEAHGLPFPVNEHNRRLLEHLDRLRIKAEKENLKSAEAASRWIIEKAEAEKIRLPERKGKNQLEAVVDYLNQIAEQEQIPEQPPLWLPPLGRKLYAAPVENYADSWRENQNRPELYVEIGMCDDPANQMQMPLRLSLTEDGNHAVCGISSSGKSTFLQTFVYDLLSRYDPSRVNAYILDFSSKMLEAFERAPQVGGIQYENDVETAGKLFCMLNKELEKRKKRFRGGNFNQYIRKHGNACPAIVLVIDNYAAFREKTENKYDDFILNYSRNGVANGMYLIVSAAGYGITEIPNRVRDNIRTTVCLEMQDRYQYMDMMGSTQIDVLPESGVKGRGLAAYGDHILEFQTYLAKEADDDYGRLEKIRESCGRMAEQWTQTRAAAIPYIPEKPVWSEFSRLTAVQDAVNSSEYLPVGYEYETADVYSVNLKRTYCYVVSGKSKTGKTNLIKLMMRGAEAKKARICTVESGGNELADLTEKLGGIYLNTCDQFYHWMAETLPLIQERNKKKKELRMKYTEEEDVFRAMAQETPYFIYIADLAAFVKMLHSKEGQEKNLENAMANIWEKGELLNIYFIAGFNWDKRMEVFDNIAFKAYCSHETGIHMGGNADAQRLFQFPGMPVREQSKSEKPGTGYVISDDGRMTWKIVTPLERG